MATDVDNDEQLMIGKSFPEVNQIDPIRERFPFCIVWTPIPLFSWLMPFIGHVGICREDGVILDFAGPNFVSVDNFAFGSVTRYLQIDEKLCLAICRRNMEPQSSNGYEGEISRWDDGVRLSTQEFQHRTYNLLTCNCHSFVANNLNRLGLRGHGWNVVSIAVLMFFKARWVGRAAIVKTCLPFLVVFSLGVALGGLSFLKFWAFFVVVLVAWFLVGSYCFRNLIEL